ncbi:MAG: PQQ-binding-like beta-propeller repeat protein [Pirellulales bacterium]
MSDRYRLCVGNCLLGWAPWVVSLVVLAALAPGPLAAQIYPRTQVELTDAIRVDEPAPMVGNQLQRVRVNFAQRQWDAGIEVLRKLMEDHGERLVRLDSRFISLRELGHRELARLPAEGLSLYRGRVDAQARQWYDEGVKHRDVVVLARVVDELFTSSYGDDALFVLGEIYLERGEYQRAREWWERISPALRSADGLPLWVEQRSATNTNAEKAPPRAEPAALEGDAPILWLAYPDTDLQLADVRARLVLASLLEGARARAETEYRSFVELHVEATGRLAGREGPYRDTLAALLNSAKEWPLLSPSRAASTFAGGPTRNFISPGEFALRSLAWSEPIAFPRKWQAHKDNLIRFGLNQSRVAEDSQNLLSYHPLVVGDLVVWHDLHCIYVYDLHTGQPAWSNASANTRPGQVYPRGGMAEAGAGQSIAHALGVPRFTATVHGSYLFVRLGSQVTSWPETSATENRGSLVVLDLAQQGKLIAEIKPESDRLSFEGPPVCDGSRLYVAMRYNDVRPQSHVACYELVATTGSSGTTYSPRLRWRRMVCAAESPARGSAEEITHNLLTLVEGTLYLNTNLGAVASLSADDGRIHWLSTYPRAKGGPENAHLFRDLNPCLYHRGTIYVAPTDTPQILALDAMTGLVRWATAPTPMADVVHLLGVAEGRLIASGKILWWLDAETGKFVTSFPEPANFSQVQPFGRGLLMGDVVVWPTRQALYVFDQKQSPPSSANTLPTMQRDPIRIADFDNLLSGGNLLAAGEYILLATADKLWAFGPKLEESATTSKDR